MRFIFPKLIFNVERWKWNKEYRIYVSNMGHFKDEYKRPIPVKINKGGYVLINGFLAHRLVMLTWCPIPGAENLTVDHLDHNKRNNAVSNLEWVTREENQRRADRDYVGEKWWEKKKEETCVVNNFYAPATINFSSTPNKIICVTHNKSFNTSLEAAEWIISQDKGLRNSGISIELVAGRIQYKAERYGDYANMIWITSHNMELLKNYKLRCSNGKIFNSIEEAVEWLMKTKPSKNKNKQSHISLMMENINKGNKYKDYRWQWVKVCGDQVGSANQFKYMAAIYLAAAKEKQMMITKHYNISAFNQVYEKYLHWGGEFTSRTYSLLEDCYESESHGYYRIELFPVSHSVDITRFGAGGITIAMFTIEDEPFVDYLFGVAEKEHW